MFDGFCVFTFIYTPTSFTDQLLRHMRGGFIYIPLYLLFYLCDGGVGPKLLSVARQPHVFVMFHGVHGSCFEILHHPPICPPICFCISSWWVPK